MNNINGVLEEKNKCFGCRACVNICPVNAISMQEDEEGFFYPVVNTEKCTNCGLCKKSCPSLNKSDVYNEKIDVRKMQKLAREGLARFDADVISEQILALIKSYV